MGENKRTVRLDSLNEDVLRIIMDLAVHGLDFDFYKFILQSPQTAIRLSHVSRQFRSLSLRCPTLWINIHGSMLPEAILAFLERSRDADLRLAFIVDGKEVRSTHDDAAEMCFRCNVLFDAASPHSKRWQSIHIIPDLNAFTEYYPVSRWQTARLRCSLALQEGPFPRLQYLDARFNEPIPMHKGFYSGWDAPGLREVIVANASPCTFHFASITKFTLVWDRWSLQNPSIESDLLAFLQSTPSLKDLSFRIDRSGIGLLDFGSLRFEETQALELPNITSLSLSTVSLSMAPTFHALLDRLYLPNISRLAVHAGVDAHGLKGARLVSSDLQTFLWLLSMIPDPALNQRPRDVELRIFAGTEHNYRERQMQIPFIKLEHVENLTLETDMRLVWSFSGDSHSDSPDTWASDFDFLTLTNASVYPINLRSLRLERCLKVEPDLVRVLVETLRQQGRGDGFETVSAFKCDPALKSGLDESLPQGRLQWLE